MKTQDAPSARGADPVLAEVLRGARVESVHRGTTIVVRGEEVIYAAGDVDVPQFWRSSAKPFQALAALSVFERAKFATRPIETALVAASHGGTPVQTEAVAALLERGGVTQDRLRCGTHAPYDPAAAAALARSGRSPLPIHHNCSGKHAGMLISARLQGLPIESYLETDHPTQIAARREIAEAAGVAEGDVGVEVDGCGAPTFILSARRAAIAFGRFGVSRRPEAIRLREAVAAEPLAYAGAGKTCTKLIESTNGRVYPKAGAEGFYAAAVPDLELGLALKFADGSHRATPAFVASLLLKVVSDWSPSARSALESMTRHPVKNAAGREVGAIRALLP